MIEPHRAAASLAELDAARELSAEAFSAAAMQLIARRFPHFQWVGIYWLRGAYLELGPFVGPATEHRRIAVGQGVCGTAVAEGANQIIQDVRGVENYLACSTTCRAEIVVLIRRGDCTVGQIDADSDQVAAFDQSDEALLAAVAERIVSRIAAQG